MGDEGTATGVFFRHIDEGPSERPPNTEAVVRWLGNNETGPYVLVAEHPVGAKVKPHKHRSGRLEYILEGEIEFFEGQDALRFWRGDPEVQGTKYGPGYLSYVPAGTLYAYRITKASKLLHIHEDNPTSVHFD